MRYGRGGQAGTGTAARRNLGRLKDNKVVSRSGPCDVLQLLLITGGFIHLGEHDERALQTLEVLYGAALDAISACKLSVPCYDALAELHAFVPLRALCYRCQNNYVCRPDSFASEQVIEHIGYLLLHIPWCAWYPVDISAFRAFAV